MPEYRNKDIYLIYDNHRAHGTADSKAAISKFAISKPIPAYSCILNGPIEAAWAIIKQKARPLFTHLHMTLRSNRQKCIEVIEKVIKETNSQVYANLLTVHFEYLMDLINEGVKNFESVNGPLQIL